MVLAWQSCLGLDSWVLRWLFWWWWWRRKIRFPFWYCWTGIAVVILLFLKVAQFWSVKYSRYWESWSHHFSVGSADNSLSRFHLIGKDIWCENLSTEKLEFTGSEEVLLPLQALAFLTEENLSLNISRTCCNACGRKGGLGIQALGGNSPSWTGINEKRFQSAHHALCWAILEPVCWSLYRNSLVRNNFTNDF